MTPPRIVVYSQPSLAGAEVPSVLEADAVLHVRSVGLTDRRELVLELLVLRSRWGDPQTVPLVVDLARIDPALEARRVATREADLVAAAAKLAAAGFLVTPPGPQMPRTE